MSIWAKLESGAEVDLDFLEKVNGVQTSERVAWWTIALGLKDATRARPFREWLVAQQTSAGSVPVSSTIPRATWPTSLAILAWGREKVFEEPRKKAVQYLLTHQGHVTSQKAAGHDQSIPGWPWVTDTHAWVEPTSLALLALRLEGAIDHDRSGEGRRLLMDRQIPSGGWNYGNTEVYGKELEALPECTGLALEALAGKVEESRVEKSLEFIRFSLQGTLTPLTLGHGLLGLSAWGRRPDQASEWIDGCAKEFARELEKNSMLACVLFVAKHCSEGMVEGVRRA